MIRRPPRSTQSRSSAASDVYKRQGFIKYVASARTQLSPVPLATATSPGLDEAGSTLKRRPRTSEGAIEAPKASERGVHDERHNGDCGEFGWVTFLAVCFLQKKTIPTHEKLFAVGKKVAQRPLFNLIFFLGWGWPWVGEFVGFIIIFTPEYTRTFSNPTEFGHLHRLCLAQHFCR